jgi:hypothetical protein
VLTCAMREGGADRNATYEWSLPALRRGGAVSIYSRSAQSGVFS